MDGRGDALGTNQGRDTVALPYDQKSTLKGFSANSLAQTFAQIYKGSGIEGASSHSGRRTFLPSLANKGTAIHILKTLAGHQKWLGEFEQVG